jgi:hypothetical protein
LAFFATWWRFSPLVAFFSTGGVFFTGGVFRHLVAFFSTCL